jgi:ureidoacrylate peracid hydrolase
MPQEYVKRMIARQGRAHTCETFDGPRTALLVVDMQNYFMAEPYPPACPAARAIVPNVNRLADAMRAAGGKVIWLQIASPEVSGGNWPTMMERFTPERARTHSESMGLDSHGFQLWHELDVRAEDERLVKLRFSAFTPGSSDLDALLKKHGIETVVVTGVATNVCCESTARDAMMLNYRAVMVSDGCATATDAEHAASIGSFYLYFGDVQTTDEIIERLKSR